MSVERRDEPLNNVSKKNTVMISPLPGGPPVHVNLEDIGRGALPAGGLLWSFICVVPWGALACTSYYAYRTAHVVSMA